MERTSVLTAPSPMNLDAPVLVVIGGLPGSGKTTLLRRLLGEQVQGVTGYDSEFVAERVQRLGLGVPYRFLRPWVHVMHRWRVLRGVRSGDPVVVLTDPWTSARWRAAVLRGAATTGRRVRVLQLDTSLELAVSGQAARGRAISDRAMRRHVERSSRRPATPERHPALVVDRRRANEITLAEVLG